MAGAIRVHRNSGDKSNSQALQRRGAAVRKQEKAACEVEKRCTRDYKKLLTQAIQAKRAEQQVGGATWRR